MTMYPAQISVTAPVTDAIERAKLMLFRPFDISKWFIIGFCAWLAGLGGSGGSSGGNFRTGGGGGPPGNAPSAREIMDQAMRFLTQNLSWIVPLAVSLLLLALVVGLLLTWVSSRGKFMFLYCVALDRAEVVLPWREFKREADSLFWFRFVLALVGMLVTLPPLAGILYIVGRMLYYSRAAEADIMSAVGLGVVYFVLAIGFTLVRKFTLDFVVPIMYLRRTNCTAAWGEFLSLLRANVGRFVLYVLFQIVLALAIGFLVMGVVILTCCIALLFLMLPYIGTVLLLPVLVFDRSYSLYYLAQFGPAYNVFAPAPPAVAAWQSQPLR
jgi:hypothetical protein